MDGRLFVQFIALILMSALRKKMRETGLIEKYTTRELLMEIKTIDEGSLFRQVRTYPHGGHQTATSYFGKPRD